MRWIALVFLSMFLSACASQAPQPLTPVYVAKGLALNLPEPNEVTKPIRARQVLTVSRGSGERSVQVVLVNQNNQLKIIGVGPMGGAIFSLKYDGKSISTKKPPTVSQSFDLKFALADIVLIYSPIEKLQSWLSAGSQVRESKGKRWINFGKKKVIEVVYDEKDLWSGKIIYHHLERDYKLTVKPVEVTWL